MLHFSSAKLKCLILLLFLSFGLLGATTDVQATERLRVIMETDAGGGP